MLLKLSFYYVLFDVSPMCCYCSLVKLNQRDIWLEKKGFLIRNL
jgi:hypothetical protein